MESLDKNMTIYLSGIQPTGKLHIGNYFGCIKPFISLVSTPVSKREKNVFLIADMHCFTKPRNVIKLNETIFDVARSLLAAGICSKNTRIVQQSKISQHAHLAWYLSCFTKFSRAENMTQYKINSFKYPNVGLFFYPILQAADILIYKPDYVIVGPDQVQHLELAIELSEKVNKFAGSNLLKIPKSFPNIIKIKSLKDETQKMSKSDPGGCLFLTDEPAEVLKKIMKAKTDSFKGISYDLVLRPCLANLINILALLKNETPQFIAEQYKKLDHCAFKETLANEYSAYFYNFRKAYASITTEETKYIIDQASTDAQMSASDTIDLCLASIYK